VAPPPAGTPGLAGPPATKPRKRPRWLLPGVGLIGLLAVGAILLGLPGLTDGGLLNGLNKSGTGADSPEEAVEQMFASMEDGDVVGIVDILNPDESRSLARLATGTAGLPERLGLEQYVPDNDGAATEVDLSSRNLDFDVDELAPDVARVNIDDGEFTARGSLQDLDAETNDEALESLYYFPLTDSLFGFSVGPSDMGVDADEESEAEADFTIEDVNDVINNDAFIVTVERGGKWYVSIGYTIAEYLRDQNEEWERPDFDATDDLRGAESPEAAVEEAIRELIAGDVEGAIDLLDPTTLAPVHDYLDAGLTNEARLDARKEIREQRVQLENISFGAVTEVDNNLYRVVVSDLRMDYLQDGEDVRWSFDGDCLSIEGGPEATDGPECLSEARNNASDPSSLAWASIAPSDIFVMVRKHNGGYFLDPVETAVQYMVEVSAELDETVLEGIGVTKPTITELDQTFDAGFTNGLEIDRYVTRTDELPIAMRISVPGDDPNAGVDVLYDLGDRVRREFISAGDQLVIAELRPSAVAVVDIRPAVTDDNFERVLDNVNVDYSVGIFALPDDSTEVGQGDFPFADDLDLTDDPIRVLDVDLNGGDQLLLNGEGVEYNVYEPQPFDPSGFADSSTLLQPGDVYTVFQGGEHRVIALAVADSAELDIDINTDNGRDEPDPIGEFQLLGDLELGTNEYTIEPGVAAVFNVEGPAELTVSITASNLDPNFDAYAELWVDGVQRDSWDDTEVEGYDASFELEVPDGETHQLRVHHFTLSEGGTFEITVDQG
jgi:hypothetical protein